MLRIVAVVHRRHLGVHVFEGAERKQVRAGDIDVHALDARLVEQVLRQRVADLQVLQTQVGAVLHPPRRGPCVVAVGHRAQTRVFGVAVVFAPGAFHQIVGGVAAGVERTGVHRVVERSAVIGRAQLVGAERRALPEGRQVEVLVGYLHVQREVHLRGVAASDLHEVLRRVDFAVAVDVGVHQVAQPFFARGGRRRIGDLLLGLEEPRRLEAVDRADRLTEDGAVHRVVVRNMLGEHLVAGPREASGQRVAPAAGEVVVVLEHQLETAVVHFTRVHVRGDVAAQRRSVRSGHLFEDVVRQLVEPVELHAQLAFPYRQVEADVETVRARPGEVVIDVVARVVGRMPRAAHDIAEAGGRRRVALHVEPCRRVVRTQFAVRCAEFEEVHLGQRLFEEILFGHDPSEGDRGEEAPAVMRRELVRTVGTEGELGEVFPVVGIADAAREAGDARIAEGAADRNVDAFPGRTEREIDRIVGVVAVLAAGHRIRVTLLLLVEEQGADVVLAAELALVGDRRTDRETVAPRRGFAERTQQVDSRCRH